MLPWMRLKRLILASAGSVYVYTSLQAGPIIHGRKMLLVK